MQKQTHPLSHMRLQGEQKEVPVGYLRPQTTPTGLVARRGAQCCRGRAAGEPAAGWAHWPWWSLSVKTRG